MKPHSRTSTELPESNQISSRGRRDFLAALAAVSASLFSSRKAKALGHLLPAEAAESSEDTDTTTTLWYSSPADNWLEALPLGNGRMGALVFGGIAHEQWMLNEATLYSEEPGGRTLPLDIAPEFEQVVALLKAGEYDQAEDIATHHWLGRCWPCYQPFGALHLEFPDAPTTGYRRQLNLTDAVHRTRYAQNGVTFEREIVVSAPDDVILCRIRSDHPAAISFRTFLDSPHPTARLAQTGSREIALTGKLPGMALRRTLDYVEKAGDTWKYPELWNKDGSRKPFAKQLLYGDEVANRGMTFEGRLRVLQCDGNLDASSTGLAVTGAGEVVLALCIASSFNGYTKSPSREGVDPSVRAEASLHKLADRSYSQLLRAHIADYQRLFNRVSFHLDGGDDSRSLATDQRRTSYTAASDPSFAALFFHYGRYLLISSSRPGGQPANLAGIWNVDRIPPWSCAYTTNINLEMNYWGTESANLPECHLPLMDFISEMSQMGRQVAQQMYHRPGWVMHHNTTLWRDAQPVDYIASTSFWPMGGGWLCQHLWEHYQFTGDESFLRETAYPIMKGAAEFYDSWLIRDDNGHLLTPVSDSPENLFYYIDKGGKQQIGGLAMGCTLDMAIIRELFANVIWTAEHFNIDDDLHHHLGERIPQLLPYQIGSRGQLLEWFKEFKPIPPRHNTSPYYPLYPGCQITPRQTPELALAEKTLLQERARETGGFPAAWMAACWARLNHPETAFPYLEHIYMRSLHPNLLNGSREIFQIDANLGAMAATVEFLLQSHAGEIELLPALPAAWKSGRVSGLRARGGFEVSMEWNAGALTRAELISSRRGQCRVRYGLTVVTLRLQKGEKKSLSGLLL